MTLTVEIAPELEEALQQAARDAGMDAAAYLIDSARRRIAPRAEKLSEAELVERIGNAVSPALRARRSTLLDRRDAEEVSAAEEDELFAVHEQIEAAQTYRWRLIGELAARRGATLAQVASDLGIPPAEVR